MKYIKDRFYNSRKRNPSLGAPDQDLFTREERSAFSCGLWVQRYNKFLKPPNIRGSFFSRALQEVENLLRNSEAAEGGNLQSYLPYISLENYVRHLWPVGSPSSLGHPLSFELQMQRYNNFSNPPNFRRSFFSRASLVRLTPIIYRSIQIAETPIIHSVISARTWRLSKRGLQATL